MTDPFGEGGLGELESPLYREALAQLDRVAGVMGLDENIHARLRVPQRAFITTFPFRREGYYDVETVFAYRVQHVLTMGRPRAASATPPTSISVRSPPWPCS